jgi:hypothetical protein
MKKGSTKDKILKQFLITKEADIALKACIKARSFRTEREYVERLIFEDFERLGKREQSDGHNVSEKIETILSLVTTNFKYEILTKKLLTNLLFLVNTQAHVDPSQKKTESETVERLQKLLKAAEEDFDKEKQKLVE